MEKTKTMNLRGNQYAQVKDRLKEFREANPNGLIETVPTIQSDGQILFKARILKDKAEQNSAEATGHALGKNSGEKAFEKLETIAVGRALALLGYAADGEIASSEEMEEFQKSKEKQLEDNIEAIKKQMTEAKTTDELKNIWASIRGDLRESLVGLKDEIKTKLDNENTNIPNKGRVVRSKKV